MIRGPLVSHRLNSRWRAMRTLPAASLNHLGSNWASSGSWLRVFFPVVHRTGPRRTTPDDRVAASLPAAGISSHRPWKASEAKHLPGGPQMRPVDHLAVEPERAEIRIVGEGGDDLFRPFALGVRRLEGRIDDIDMLGMDQGLGGKAVAPRRARDLFEAGEIVDVGMDGVDGCDFGRRGADQAEIPRQS